MNTEEYTPTQVEVEGRYISGQGKFTRASFRRWLAKREREVTVRALRDVRDEFAAAALRGIEPTLNHAVARLMHDRALRIERGSTALAVIVIPEVES